MYVCMHACKYVSPPHGKVGACGGDAGGATYLVTFAQDKWEGLPPMKVARTGLGVGALNGEVLE
jgi:hypothetical protein